MNTAMINYSIAMLNALAAFLQAEPIIYLVGLILLCYVAKVIKILITVGKR